MFQSSINSHLKNNQVDPAGTFYFCVSILLDVGRWTLDVGLWTLDFGLWILDIGLWTVIRSR